MPPRLLVYDPEKDDYYVVVKDGDTVWDIAAELGFEDPESFMNDKLCGNDNLTPGQRIYMQYPANNGCVPLEATSTTTSMLTSTTALPSSTTTSAPAPTAECRPVKRRSEISQPCLELAQRILRRAGYANADPRYRVSAYQANQRLPDGTYPLSVDGDLGALTYSHILLDPGLQGDDLLGGEEFARFNELAGKVGRHGWVVDTDRQVAAVYHKGVFIGAYKVTTGQNGWVSYVDKTGQTKYLDARTPHGSFEVYYEINGSKWSEYQDPTDLRAEKAMTETHYLIGGVAVHAVPDGWVSFMLETRSKGCIRVVMADMTKGDANGRVLDDYINKGTLVLIVGTESQIGPKPEA